MTSHKKGEGEKQQKQKQKRGQSFAAELKPNQIAPVLKTEQQQQKQQQKQKSLIFERAFLEAGTFPSTRGGDDSGVFLD